MLTSEHLQAKKGRTLRRGVAGFLPLLVFSLLAATSLHAGSRVTSPAASYDENPLAEPRLESVGVGIIPRDVVPTMAQDKAGFLWIATGDGLVRYDGYRFRPQERESPDPAARNLGWIRALLAGSDGRLWIGTEWDGLAVYDPTTEKVSSWRGKGEERDSQNGGPLPTIRALAEDRDGSIWAGSEGGGLDHFDLKSGNVSHYLHSSQPGSLPDDRVQALLIDRAGDLWVGTWAGLSRLKAGGERFEPVVSNGGRASLAGRIVEALFQASDGRIWVGTQQGDLAIVDPSTGKVLFLDFAEDIANHGAVSSLAEAPGGRMWVGRSTGIDLHDVADGRLVQRLRHDLRKRWGLAGNEVTALIRDQAGLIWVGGFGVGLQRHDPNNRSIWLRGADPQPDSPFSEADVRSLLQLDNGEIWAATHKGGVAVMDKLLRVTGAIWPRTPGQINATGKSPKLPPVRVEAMAQARDGTVWLGSDSMLYQFSRDHRQLQTLPHGGGLTRRLLAGSDGTLWVATQDGVYFLRPDKGEVVRVLIGLSHTPTTGSMLSNCVNLGLPWRLTFLSGAIWCFHARCRSFSGCFRTRQHVRHTLSVRDGAMASPVLVVAHPVSLTVSPLAPAYSVVGSVAVTRASPLAPSWNARTRRSRFGSGQRTWSPVKRPACRRFSSSGNSDSRATRPPSRFFTSCASAWCAPIRIELVVSPRNTSRPMKPTSVGVLAAKGRASTTWYSWQAQSKSASASSKGAATNAEPGATQGVFALPLCQIAAPSRWADSLSAPLHPAPSSSLTTGAVTRSWATAAIAIPPSPSGATCKLPRPSCRSFTSCFPISRPGCVEPITVSARNTYRPTSTNSPSASTVASTRSTLSVLCSASPAMSPLPHTPISTPQNHDSLHLVGVCDNPISTDRTIN